MKLTDWHKRLTSELPHAEVIRPPGQRGATDGPGDSVAMAWSVAYVWLGYGRYEIEARASSPDADIDAVTCSVMPRDMRKGIEYRSVIYEASMGTRDTMERLLFAILDYEAQQNV